MFASSQSNSTSDPFNSYCTSIVGTLCPGWALARNRPEACPHLLFSQPGQKEPVRLHIFPIRNEAARHFPAMPPEQPLELFAREPLLPLRRLESSPLLGVLVDDGDA